VSSTKQKGLVAEQMQPGQILSTYGERQAKAVRKNMEARDRTEGPAQKQGHSSRPSSNQKELLCLLDGLDKTGSQIQRQS
tara:strand:+ start:1334 stop:1573 length:240 start_codon:yes stop_codon:yes gene_type:complete